MNSRALAPPQVSPLAVEHLEGCPGAANSLAARRVCLEDGDSSAALRATLGTTMRAAMCAAMRATILATVLATVLAPCLPPCCHARLHLWLARHGREERTRVY